VNSSPAPPASCSVWARWCRADDAASIPPTDDWVHGREAIASQIQASFDSVDLQPREDGIEKITVLGDDAVEVGHCAWTDAAKEV